MDMKKLRLSGIFSAMNLSLSLTQHFCQVCIRGEKKSIEETLGKNKLFSAPRKKIPAGHESEDFCTGKRFMLNRWQ